MGLVPAEIVVTGTGHIYAGDVGVAFPASISDPVDLDDWVDLGYTTPAGAKFKFGRDVNLVEGWQSFDPLRIIVTKVPKEISFELLQWNQHTMKLGLGGGEVTEPSPGEYEYEPPDESFVDTRAFIIEGIDGEHHYRFCYRKGLNTNGVEFAFVRQDPVQFPITVQILAADGGAKPYLIQTDDENIGELIEAGS